MKKTLILLLLLLTLGCGEQSVDEHDLKLFLEEIDFSPTLTIKHDDGYEFIREDSTSISMYFLYGKSNGRYEYVSNSYSIRERGVYLGILKDESFTMYVSDKKLERNDNYFKIKFQNGAEVEYKFEEGKKAYRITDSRIREMEFNIFFYNNSGEEIFRFY